MGQLVWLTLLAGHATLAAVWRWLMPTGFPSSASEYWVNEVAPPIVIVLCVLAILPPKKMRAILFPCLLGAMPFFWIAAAISARLTFPRSVGLSWNITFFASLGVGVLWWRQLRPSLSPQWLVLFFALPAAWAGWSFPSTQRAPEPTQIASAGAFTDLPKAPIDRRLQHIGKNAQLHPDDARLVIRRDKLVLTVDPLLSFLDRSPDRTWVSLAEAEDAKPTVRKLIATHSDKVHWQLEYTDEDKSLLDVSLQNGALAIDALCRLAEPVFSHLNTYAEVTIRGHRKLSLAFSPAPSQRIELPSPTSPARFAYVDNVGMFHVAEATEHKVGPFRELASGKLTRSEPLRATIYDGDSLVFVVTLSDWPSQAVTALSPAAGSLVPQNDIEFARGGEGDDAPAYIVLSLATTSIGRGSQSVGHVATTYRNRMTISAP